jgi:hypothetical protein
MHVQNITNYYIELVAYFYTTVYCWPVRAVRPCTHLECTLSRIIWRKLRLIHKVCDNRFGRDFLYLFNTSSSAIPQIPLCRMMLGLNSELFCRQTTWMDLILIFNFVPTQKIPISNSAGNPSPASNFGVLCRRSFTDGAVCIKKLKLSIEHTGLLNNLIHKYLCWRVNLPHLSLFYPLFYSPAGS